MVIIWGTTHAGKVDEAPGGMFHVVTQFGHLYYIPLIPTGSYMVFEKNNDGSFRGMPIGLSFKSILAGWIRGLSIVAILGAALGLIVSLTSIKAAPNDWVLPVAVLMIAGALLWASYFFMRRASYERAMHLAKLAGYTDMGLLMIEVAYGRLTPAEADAELARREEAMEAQLVNTSNASV